MREIPVAAGMLSDSDLRRDVAALLHGQVAAMNPSNFVVRPQRPLVEKYAKADGRTSPRPS